MNNLFVCLFVLGRRGRLFCLRDIITLTHIIGVIIEMALNINLESDSSRTLI